MKVTIIYGDTAFRKDLQANWGFSALKEDFIKYGVGKTIEIKLNKMC